MSEEKLNAILQMVKDSISPPYMLTDIQLLHLIKNGNFAPLEKLYDANYRKVPQELLKYIDKN